MEVLIRPYKINDLEALKKVFELNTPKYFAAHELKEFTDYLETMPDTYLVMELNGSVIGGVGYEVRLDDNSGRINWIFINPGYFKSGYGKKACEYCIEILKQSPDVKKLVVRTSQLAYEFFRKLNYDLIEVKRDYWAPGLDLYLMEQPLNKE